jgi:hypothetical protein
LKLKYDTLLSILLQFCFTVAFNFKLRPYNKGLGPTMVADVIGTGRVVQVGPIKVKTAWN